MLCISLMPGEYFTVDGSTIVQYGRLSGERVHLTVHAPREVPVLRGEVLERNGGKRPECVMPVSKRYVRQLAWDHRKKQALAELRQTLEQMEDTPETQAIRERLNIIFPQQA